jgi:hypothetical protein
MSQLAQNVDAYREGLFARALGQSCRCNPYPEDSDDEAHWILGWWLIEGNAASTLDDDFEQGWAGHSACLSVDDASREFVRDRANSTAPLGLGQTVEVAQTLATGILLAVAGFALSYAILRSFLL